MAIKQLRESNGMTQIELAEKIGVARSAVAMWETGQSVPRTDKLIALSKIFNCTIDELIKIKTK